tara:strand:+ start:115 stop:507 length:393 start_codon:yes stop_codon:yes gene_type:complete
MTLELWLIIILILSLVLNLLLLWFAREQSTKITYVSQNIGDLVEIIASYRDHLKAIYQLDTYYGDDNIKYLFEHTRSLIQIIEEEYADVTSLTEPLEVEFEEAVKIEEKIEESKPYGENVFYAGSRERNT